ncbi:protein son of sevenless [Pelomyxa schiedti]|nr:protein son of sevenless [Pelomyxa schiedti]
MSHGGAHRLFEVRPLPGQYAACDVCKSTVCEVGFRCSVCNITLHKICQEKANEIVCAHKSSTSSFTRTTPSELGGVSTPTTASHALDADADIEVECVTSVPKAQQHDFAITTFYSPTFCQMCENMIWGVSNQGLKCNGCQLITHKKCKPLAMCHPCGTAIPPQSKAAPATLCQHTHEFETATFHSPTYCKICGGLLWGIVNQGMRCTHCLYTTHKKCKEQALTHDCPRSVPRDGSSTSPLGGSHVPDSSNATSTSPASNRSTISSTAATISTAKILTPSPPLGPPLGKSTGSCPNPLLKLPPHALPAPSTQAPPPPPVSQTLLIPHPPPLPLSQAPPPPTQQAPPPPTQQVQGPTPHNIPLPPTAPPLPSSSAPPLPPQFVKTTPTLNNPATPPMPATVSPLSSSITPIILAPSPCSLPANLPPLPLPTAPPPPAPQRGVSMPQLISHTTASPSPPPPTAAPPKQLVSEGTTAPHTLLLPSQRSTGKVVPHGHTQSFSEGTSSAAEHLFRRRTITLGEPMDQKALSARTGETIDFFFGEPDREDNVRYALDASKSTILWGCTIVKLIEKVTAIHSDLIDIRSLLLTMNGFTTPMELLKLLHKRFDASNNIPAPVFEAIQIEVIRIVREWVDFHFDAFHVDPLLLDCLNDFITHMYTTKSDHVLQSAKCLKGALATTLFSYEIPQTQPTPPKPLHKQGEALTSLMGVRSLELARQLTLLEYSNFRNLKPEELLGLGWCKPDASKTSPNVVRSTQFFNQFSNWLSWLIVASEKVKDRQKILKKFLKVAEYCKELNNFGSFCQIVAAMNSSAVRRLRKTWTEELETKLRSFDAVLEFNFKILRELLSAATPPLVPFMGMILSDLTFAEDGNPDRIPDNPQLINWAKMKIIGRILEQLKRWQQVPFNLTPVPVIQNLINSAEAQMPQPDVYQASLKIEPRGS